MEIDGYREIEPLARGGAAKVYLAEEESAGRRVAIKVLDARSDLDPELVPRFQREARVIAALQHPNIVPILDFGSTRDGYLYYSMPWMKTDLAGFGWFDDEDEIRRVLAELCDALSYAHARGVIHRDIKPANVYLSAERSARLGDFGMALMTAADATRLTAEGIAVGTATYMSPEQAQAKTLDHRTDLYSLGVLAYEMLSRRPPFNGTDAITVAAAHIGSEVPPLPARWASWQSFIDRALAKQAADRFDNAHEMKRSLPGIGYITQETPSAVEQVKPALATPPKPLVTNKTSEAPPGLVQEWMLYVLGALVVVVVVLVASQLL